MLFEQYGFGITGLSCVYFGGHDPSHSSELVLHNIFLFPKLKIHGSWMVGFYGILTFVGYFTPNPFYANNQFYFKQFSLAWVHSLIVKNISISSYSVYANSSNSV